MTLEQRIQFIHGKYGYRIKSMNGGTDRYGVCEVCKKSVDTTYYQVEARKTDIGWTYADCHSLFGHKECLERRRKQ